MSLIPTNDIFIVALPAVQSLTLKLAGDQENKLRLICILSFLSQYPVSEDYFKEYAGQSGCHWRSIFRVDGLWSHLKFIRHFQELEDLSLGSWVAHGTVVLFKFRADAREFRHLAFNLAQQQDGFIEAIRLLGSYAKSISRASRFARTDMHLVGHVDVCLDAEANLFGDAGQGVIKERDSLKLLGEFYQEMGRYRDAEILYHLILGMDYNLQRDPGIQGLLDSLGVVLDL
ncbi:MAG: hypothetical protein GOMPHAMPRED_005415 [Gomphillus americanus]|uniref:Tetratricopeptide repeat protein n=1 Tax=Gomphillus americanus TaxID=1940652 RepID=A0A8H3FXH0_9LECA|nr:MAG: hypothetical protein GOMPHAMPRED_005415 [Gomphillus americanus]